MSKCKHYIWNKLNLLLILDDLFHNRMLLCIHMIFAWNELISLCNRFYRCGIIQI